MKWVICQYCKAEYAVTDDESIKDWGKCEVCGHNDWKEEPQLMNEDNEGR